MIEARRKHPDAPQIEITQQAWVSHFVIAPPLIVTKEELDLGLDALDRHLGIADALVD